MITDTTMTTTMPADEYHRDPCPEPSLSSHIASVLYQRTPLHAFYKHPRLNPNYRSEERNEFDFGTAVHAMVLEDGGSIEIIDADDWRTKAAKEMRDAARLRGKTPILAHKMVAVERAAAQVALYMGQTEFKADWPDGLSEVSMFALDGGVWLRGRLDRISADQRIIFDLKTTSGSAEPSDFCRKIVPLGYDIQAAMYRRLVRLTCDTDAAFMWVVVEDDEPYGVSVVGCDPGFVQIGDRKLDICIKTWARCLKSGAWPGYDTRTAWAGPTAWELAASEDRALKEEGE